MDAAGIYRISFGDSRNYVGSAVNLRKRRNKHLSELRRGTSPCLKLQRAFSKYGERLFNFEVIETCSIERLRNREELYIKLYNSVEDGFNVATDTSVPMLGRTHSAETKKLMAVKATGNKGRSGQKLTPEHVELMRMDRKGKLVGTTNNVGETNAGAKLTEEKVREVYLLKGKKSQSEIADSFGISQQQVSRIHSGAKWASVTKNLILDKE